MTDDIIFGSRVPSWSFNRALVELENKEVQGFRNSQIDPSSDLSIDLWRDHGWAVRHQHARGTCNAFAVVAAEELRRFHDSGKTAFTPLSEEHLYAKARGKRADRLIGGGNQAAQEALEDGGTFLGQMLDALIENGLADAADVEYRPYADIDFAIADFDPQIEGKAEQRTVSEDQLTHDITRAVVGIEREWLNESKRPKLADFFARQLTLGKPVVAAFAILNDAEYAWTGQYARASGHVRYPTDRIVADKRPVAGHSVCLVGHIENPEDEDSDNPWIFLFRNSYGTEIFARDADRFEGRPNTGRPGYGIISARDVSRYCWEFLTSASPEEIQALQGRAPSRADII